MSMTIYTRNEVAIMRAELDTDELDLKPALVRWILESHEELRAQLEAKERELAELERGYRSTVVEPLKEKLAALKASHARLVALVREGIDFHETTNDCGGPKGASDKDCLWCVDARREIANTLTQERDKLAAKLAEMTQEHDAEHRALEEAVAKIATLKEKLAKTESLVYVPGLYRCAKCDFRLLSNTLHVNTGAVTANNAPGQQCANGCGPMWPVTEREAGNTMVDRLEKASDEITALKARLAEAALTWVELQQENAARVTVTVSNEGTGEPAPKVCETCRQVCKSANKDACPCYNYEPIPCPHCPDCKGTGEAQESTEAK